MHFSESIIDHTGGQTMLYLTCTMIPRIDLACYRILHAKVLGFWKMCYNSDYNLWHNSVMLHSEKKISLLLFFFFLNLTCQKIL